MSASESAVTAGTTAVLAVPAGWSRWQVFNNGAVDVFYGYTSGVTTATGTPIKPLGSAYDWLPWLTAQSPTIYVITASGTADCRALRVE